MVVVSKKDKSAHIGVVLTKSNEALHREKYILPSVDQPLDMLAGALFFSKLSANIGF